MLKSLRITQKRYLSVLSTQSLIDCIKSKRKTVVISTNHDDPENFVKIRGIIHLDFGVKLNDMSMKRYISVYILASIVICLKKGQKRAKKGQK